jgi:hypothetical protein
MKCYFVVVVIAAMMAASTVQAVLECRNSANGVDRCGDGVKACMVKTFYKEITFKTDIASVWGCGESDHDSCEKNTVSGTRYTVHGTRNTVHGTRYTVHGTRNTVHGIRYTVHGTLYTVHGEHMLLLRRQVQ